MTNKFFIFLIIFATSLPTLCCNLRPLPHEWPLFANREKSLEIQKEAEEFFEYLVEEAENGQECLMDAWAHREIEDGIKHALGFKEFRAMMKKASRANGFALLALSRLDSRFRQDDTFKRLAGMKNPAFLTEIALNPEELKYFWDNYGDDFKDFPGRNPKEKLLNLAIKKKWNKARLAKAETLFENYLEDANPSYLEEAFSQLRYAASRGYALAMYQLHIQLQKYPEYKIAENEEQLYLEAATELEFPSALYTSAVILFEQQNFILAKERLTRLLTNAEQDLSIKWLADNAKDLMILIELAERGFKQAILTNGMTVNRSYEKNSYLITPSMREMISKLRKMLAEIDAMKKELAQESTDEDSDDARIDEPACSRQLPSETESYSAPCAQKKPVQKSASMQTKLSQKKSKVEARKTKRAQRPAQNREQGEIAEASIAANPFAELLKARLMPVRGLVETMLNGQHLNGREIQSFFNAFENVNLTNTVGSHHRVNLQYAEAGPSEKITIVAPHKGKKRRDLTGKYKSMTSKLKSMLNDLGIRKIEDLE